MSDDLADDIGLGMERTARLLAGSVWDELTPVLRRRSTRISAAVAYIGPNADHYLPLRSGASIIVDADERTVAQRMTDPHTLVRWIKAGVNVYSLPRLHAKVILCEGSGAEDAFVVVGSANVSRTSATKLHEAALLTDSPDAVAETRDALIDWKAAARTPLDLAACRRLCEIYDEAATDDGAHADDVDGADDESGGEPASDAPDVDDDGWVRPTRIHVAPVNNTDDMSAEAQLEHERLADELGIPDGELAVGDPLLEVFWDDFDRRVDQDMYGEGSHVILVWRTSGGRLTNRCAAASPGQVIHKWVDENVTPARTYYYLLAPHSDSDVELGDLKEALSAVGVTLDYESGYQYQPRVDALLSLWPDLSFT